MIFLCSWFFGASYTEFYPQDEEEEEEEYEEIDPSAIVPRRTRGVRVDYSSEEALKKAGMTKEDIEKDDDEEGMKH
jgi:hypothetical protein